MSIVIDHVTKVFKQSSAPVVRDISLDIEQGELFVLLGPSGSGKSTLLRIIAGLTPLDSGMIGLNGRDVTTLTPQQRHIGFVFQNYSLFQHMTAAQNIAFGLEIQKVPRADRNRRVKEMLELIEMADYGNRLPSQLSGGQQQRVAVARALAPSPDVLLLDEPFGALDVKIRTQLRQNLREIQKQLNVPTILVTHDQQEAFELADRIGIIEDGRLLEVGTPDQLYRKPSHRFTAMFLGSANLLPAQRNGSKIYLGDHDLPAPAHTEHLANQPVEVMLRPEEIEVANAAEDLTGHRLGRGTVTSIAFAGSLEHFTIQLPEWEYPVQAFVNPEVARNLAVRPGDQLYVGVKDFHLIPLN
jgi:sulfate/thiosulfate transport system ATP-binding protein